jgi:hypothetical protein
MATDADIVPQALTDFVFDLYDSVSLSQLTEEQGRLYNNVFRDLSQKVCIRHQHHDNHDFFGWLIDSYRIFNLTDIIHSFFVPIHLLLLYLTCSTLLPLHGHLQPLLPPSVMVILSFLLFIVN